MPVYYYGQDAKDVLPSEDRKRFEELVLPHVDAALNLAKWLLGNRADAEDVTQEALLRAYRFFATFRGGDARAWLLQIVRNCCYSFFEKSRPAELLEEFDEEMHPAHHANPEISAVYAADRHRVTSALESLPARSREILVLREIEGCSYKEIAEITATPIGTVMSTLSRGRERLHRALTTTPKEAS